MTVILKSSNGIDVQVNWWNWRPTVALFGKVLALSEEQIEKLQINRIGVSVSATETQAIATFLDGYLPLMPEGGRVLPDGTISSEPKSRELDLIGKRNYSADLNWLSP